MKLLKHLRSLPSRQQFVTPPPSGQVWSRTDGRHDVALHGHLAGVPRADEPLVILEAGLGCPAAAWAWVQEGLAERGMASLALDRPGIGWSSPFGSGAPTTGEHLHNLESVLVDLGHRGPLWLIGHSVGGLLIRSIAERYARRTYGLTFVDSTHPDQLRSSSQREAVLRHKHALHLMLRQSRSSKSAERQALDESPLGRLPEPIGGRILDVSRSRTHIKASLAELERWPDWAGDAARVQFVDAPVHVVSAEKTLTPDPIQAGLHQELTTLSGTAHHHVVDGADHQSLVMDPNHAAAITRTVMFPSEGQEHSVAPTPNNTSLRV